MNRATEMLVGRAKVELQNYKRQIDNGMSKESLIYAQGRIEGVLEAIRLIAHEYCYDHDEQFDWNDDGIYMNGEKV